MPDLAKFHEELLGSHVVRTARQKALYEAFDAGVRGYSKEYCEEDLNQEEAVAAIILGLYQTQGKFQVLVFVPPVLTTWYIEQIQLVARRAFKVRAKSPQGVRACLQAFKCMLRVERVFQVGTEPERWTMFGFSSTGMTPPWAANKLLETTP